MLTPTHRSARWSHLLWLAAMPWMIGCGDAGSFDNGSAAGSAADSGVTPSAVRTTAGLQALYVFGEGAGEVVRDTSGLSPAADLKIKLPAAVEWLPDGGLRINDPTPIVSELGVVRLSRACQMSGEVTLEAWARPAAIDKNQPTTLVSIGNNADTINANLSQLTSYLDARVRTTQTNDAGNPALLSPTGTLLGRQQAAGAPAAAQHLVFTYGGESTRLYVDGAEVAQLTLLGNFSNWGPAYPVALASEANEQRLWTGELYLVAIYCRALTASEVTAHHQVGY